MERIERIAALAASALLTLVAFDLMVGPAAGMLRIGRLTGDRMIAAYLAGGGAPVGMSLTGTALELPILILLGMAVGIWLSYRSSEGPGENGAENGSGRDLGGRRSSGLGSLRVSGSEMRP